MAILTPDQLNSIAKDSGYTGGSFSSVGLPTAPTTLTSSSIASNPAIQVPQAPQSNTDYYGMLAGGNATIGANTPSITPPAPTTTDTTVTPPPAPSISDSITSYINNVLGKTPAPPSATDQYNTDYANSGIDAKQTQFNTDNQAYKDAQARLTASQNKLTGLNTEFQTANYNIPNQDQVDAKGRGITATGLAPKTADELRLASLNYTPKIAAQQGEVLGYQAEVAAAQGNAQLSQSILQQAQDQFNKVFQIHETDAQAQYKYKLDLIDKAYTFASNEEQKQLDAQKATLATNNSQYNNFVNDVRAAATSASNSFQGTVATKLSQLVSTLDPNSKTFASDYQKAQQTFATLQGQIQGKTTAPRIIGSASTGYSQVNADGSTTPVTTTPPSNPNPPTDVPTQHVTTLKNALNQSKFNGPEADGKYADPNLYLQNYQSWINPPNNGSPEAFFKAFPPATYINPANTFLPQEIMKFVPKATGSSSGNLF